MSRIECPHEADVVTMVYTGRWPERAPDELRAHAETCQVCSDVAVVAAAIEAETTVTIPALPSSGTMWWRAQIRSRQEAARAAVRPITAAQALGLAALFGAAGAIFGASAQWFQTALGWLGRTLSSAASTVRLPSVPTDLSGMWIGYWVILLAVVASLIAAAAVVGWAVKEDKT